MDVGNITQTAFSPDGELLAVIGSDGAAVLETRHMQTVSELREPGVGFGRSANVHVQAAPFFAFSADSRLLLAASRQGLHLLDVASGVWHQPAASQLAPIHCVAFSQSGHLAAVGTDSLTSVWDLDAGREVQRFDSPEEVKVLAFGMGDSVLVAATGYRLLRFWNVRRATQVLVADHELQIHGITASRTAPIAATTAHDGTARLWELTGPDSVATLPALGSDVYPVQFSDDGAWLAFEADASGYSGVSVWQLHPLGKLSEISGYRVRLLGFAADDRDVFVHQNSVLGLGGPADFDQVVRHDVVAGRAVDTLRVDREEKGFLHLAYSQKRGAMAYAYSEGQPVLVELGEIWERSSPPDSSDTFPSVPDGAPARMTVWPNPSRAGVSIRFTLRDTGPVRIEVYDLAGHRVRTLARGATGAGAHALSWDGRDANGGSVAAGVYILRLTTRQGSVIRKLVRFRGDPAP